MRQHRVRLAWLLLSGAVVWVPQAARADFAHLTLQSQPGDFIGQGKNFDITYTPANSESFFAQINQTLPDGRPTYLSFILGTVTSGSDNTFAILDFSTAQLGIPIQPGVYNDAQRAAFAGPGHPGLDVGFQNRGSNTLTGNFTITDVSFFRDASNTLRVGSFDASFEQHSEGVTPALFGTFQFQSSAVPEPSSLVLAGTGGVLLFGYGWYRRKAAAR